MGFGSLPEKSRACRACPPAKRTREKLFPLNIPSAHALAA
jgi:hypothetical protein